MQEADQQRWRERIDLLIGKLSGIKPDEFFDYKTLQYHPGSQDIWVLADAFETDQPAWKAFWDANTKARSTWLPLDPEKLSEMDAQEIYFRLRENLIDERFLDGALSEAFESGSLTKALEILGAALSEFELKTDGLSGSN